MATWPELVETLLQSLFVAVYITVCILLNAKIQSLKVPMYVKYSGLKLNHFVCLGMKGMSQVSQVPKHKMSKKPEWLVVVWWSQSHLWCVHQVCMQVLASYLFYQTPQWQTIAPLKWSIVRNDKSENQRFLEPVVKKTRWLMWHKMGSHQRQGSQNWPVAQKLKNIRRHTGHNCVCVCVIICFLKTKAGLKCPSPEFIQA